MSKVTKEILRAVSSIDIRLENILYDTSSFVLKSTCKSLHQCNNICSSSSCFTSLAFQIKSFALFRGLCAPCPFSSSSSHSLLALSSLTYGYTVSLPWFLNFPFGNTLQVSNYNFLSITVFPAMQWVIEGWYKMYIVKNCAWLS